MSTVTQTLDESAQARQRRLGRRWIGTVLGLIGLNMLICAVTVYYAMTDKAFSVESDYDTRALHWDDTVRRRGASERLGWSCAIEPLTIGDGSRLTIRLTNSKGEPVPGAIVRAELFHQGTSSLRQALTLTQTGPGVYSAAPRVDRAGLWELHLLARAPEGEYTQTRTLRVGMAETPP